MNKTIIGALLMGSAMTLAAQDSATAPAKTAKPKTAKVKTVQAIKPLTIPAGAVKGKDGYRYTDAQGKVWIYRETPFGITRAPETAALVEATPETAVDPDAHVTAVADGDTVHFERVGPFGPTRWQKSKAELTPQEQKIWDREQAKGKQ